eukprot:TRINITY_DN50912_c0_g2_i1.p1 TRINITY_DN50912_c0_g2~~TRINITY_DN50912_c0_g2_i1.p1  ORF type:complete len:919 (-),score=199.89 TRINITY_DN50912_c0_g2_i1:72-2828(-)
MEMQATFSTKSQSQTWSVETLKYHKLEADARVEPFVEKLNVGQVTQISADGIEHFLHLFDKHLLPDEPVRLGHVRRMLDKALNPPTNRLELLLVFAEWIASEEDRQRLMEVAVRTEKQSVTAREAGGDKAKKQLRKNSPTIVLKMLVDEGEFYMDKAELDELAVQEEEDEAFVNAAYDDLVAFMDVEPIEAQQLCDAITTSPEGIHFAELRFLHLKTISRDVLVEQTADKTERDENFMSLPRTGLLMFAFTMSISGHLNIYFRQRGQNALYGWMVGQDPVAYNNGILSLDSCQSFWDWMDEYGIEYTLGSNEQEPGGQRRSILATQHILLGDMKVSYSSYKGKSESVWLLKHPEAVKVLEANKAGLAGTVEEEAAVRLQAGKVAANYLSQNGWNSPDISKLQLHFYTYAEKGRLISMTSASVKFSPVHTLPELAADSVHLEVFSNWGYLAPDAVFVWIVFGLMVNETKEMCATIRQGFGEFAQYWQFWNCVDWITIVLGFGMMALLTIVSLFQQHAIIQGLLTDYNLTENPMTLAEAQLDDIEQVVQGLISAMYFTQVECSLLVCSIVAKFFKAFTANLRLKVVTDTFISMEGDMAHFLVIFCAIFVPFAVIGHVLFGNDLSNFADLGLALNSSLLILFGDFGWYTELTGIDLETPLPSGMPKSLACVWYFLYEVIVLLVLMNIVLAIVMEHYVLVADRIKTVPDAPSLAQQYKRLKRYKKESKGFMPLETVRLGLENDEDPAHKEEVVTACSLKSSWPEMGDNQVQWILRWLINYTNSLDQHNEEDDSTSRVNAAIGDFAGKVGKLDNMIGTTAETTREEFLQTIGDSLAGLRESMENMQKEQYRLAKRTQQVTEEIYGPSNNTNSKTGGGLKVPEKKGMQRAISTGSMQRDGSKKSMPRSASGGVPQRSPSNVSRR